ncbi:MAG TPA: hypothetical protein EYN66_19635 [Myxococcales bacterium]|nr:hypothetical protein [Myxococcales bacterium]
MIIGGISLYVDDIISIRMNWRIQLERTDVIEAFTPHSTDDYGVKREVADSGTPDYSKPKGEYWSKTIVKWLIQRVSPFWNTFRTTGDVMLGVSAYVGAKVWQATGGRVATFIAKQSLRQMVLRPALGGAGLVAAYFAAVAVLGHDVYVMLENHPAKTKWLGEGLDLGGGAGGFGA